MVDGHTEYLSSVDETVEIVLDVYTNVEPLHVSIATNTDTSETTALWTIKENTRRTVGVPVYNQKILISGFRIAADFEVQAEKNYGDYKVVLRNDIGSTTHNFKVLARSTRFQFYHNLNPLFTFKNDKRKIFKCCTAA